MTALLAAWAAKVWAKTLLMAAAAGAVLAACLAIFVKGEDAEKKKEAGQAAVHEEQIDADVDQIRQRMDSPGAPDASIELHKEFGRN